MKTGAIIAAVLFAAMVAGCGGGGDSAGPGVSDEDAEMAELIAIVEELGRLYEKNAGREVGE